MGYFSKRFIQALLVLIFIVTSCKKQESTTQQTNQPLTSPAPKGIIKQDTGYVPVLDSIPSTLTLNASQLADFNSWWEKRWEYMWTNVETEYKDSVYLVHLQLKPNFNFIKSLKTPDLLRYQQYIHESLLRLPCITDPDSLNAMKIPMLTAEACMRLFGQKDSIFLMQSYEHYYELKRHSERNVMCHIFYNHPERKYILKTIDTLGVEHSTIDLFKVSPDPNESFILSIAIPSSLQVIRKHHHYNEQTGLTRQDSGEYKRVFIDTSGAIYDWTNRLISPQKYCYPVPPDSTFDPNFHRHQDMSRSTPLSYSMQKEILHVKSIKDAEFPFGYTYYPYGFPLFYFQYFIADFGDRYLYTVANASHSTILVLADKKRKIIAAREINPMARRMDNEYDQFYGRIASNGTVHLVNPYNIVDTLGKITVAGSSMISTVPRFKALTMPISDLDPYFSYSDIWDFTHDSMENIYEKLSHLKQFPDSIYTCIRDMASANGGQFFGKNYSIMHPSSGLTYIVVFHEGNIEGYLSLFIIDKNNVMQNEYLHLAGGGGDEGDYWGTTGNFLNDSTYTSTDISCSYESHCDSTIVIHHIHSDGTITVNNIETQWYRKPYR